MPDEVKQDNIEFGWNDSKGYIKNNGKYNILYTKPTLSFPFKALMFATSLDISNMIVNMSNITTEFINEEQIKEVKAYVIANTLSDPWETQLPDT